MKASKSKPSGCLLPIKSRGILILILILIPLLIVIVIVILILILILILGTPEQKQNHTMN